MLNFILNIGVCVWPQFFADIDDWDNNEIKLIKLLRTCPCRFSELYRSTIEEREIADNQIITCLIATSSVELKFSTWEPKLLQAGDMITVTNENISRLIFSKNEFFIIVHIYSDVSV